jgi:hypothetical protein
VKRALLSFCVLTLLSGKSAGCVYIPGPPVVSRGSEHPMGAFGNARSDKPVRPGANRAEVRGALGNPDLISPDGMRECYYCEQRIGWLICLIPAGHIFLQDFSNPSSRDLVISYDAAGAVKTWELSASQDRDNWLVPGKSTTSPTPPLAPSGAARQLVR